MIIRLFSVLCLCLCFGGCASTSSQLSLQERRQSLLDMQASVLSELYRLKPHVKFEIATAPGYAVFKSANVNLILASFAGGNGVVKDHATGGVTYMKMAELGVGPGLGLKDFRLVFVFHDKDTLARFVNRGWSLGVQAEAAAKSGDRGAAVGAEVAADNFTVYQLTDRGLALQLTIKGAKFWRDAALNMSESQTL